jgi:DUF4097 and DUF4098 domain-containing protein YvlB
MSAKGISSVQVNAIQDVEVTAWTKDSVKVVCLKGDVNSGKIEVKSVAGSIHIKDMEPVCEKISINMPGSFKLKVTVISGVVTVKDLKGGTRVSTVSGEVKIKNATGALEVESVSGQINVTGTKGDLTCKTVSGAIEVLKVDAEHLTAKSVSGEVSVKSAKSNRVQLVSHSGEITFKGSPLPKTELSAKTFSGEIEIEVSGTTGFDISAKTMSGEIEVEHKIQASTLSENRVNGRFKQGGPDLTLKSFSGEITVKISK